jgi:hypothetical protein
MDDDFPRIISVEDPTATPGESARFQVYPHGIHVTIVNGVPIVLDGKLTGHLPGQVVSPA